MTNSLTLFVWLVVAHALADYPLQGDFMAKAKNQRAPVPGVPFYWPLLFHAAIHAGAVLLVTASPTLAALEFVAHTAIDYEKSAGRIDFDQDQLLHLGCKVLWSMFV